MNVQTITDSPRADADEITITAPELPARSQADRIEQYLIENPPSPLTFPAGRPISAVQYEVERHRDWHLKSGREILAMLLSRERFSCVRMPTSAPMSIADLIESEYSIDAPCGRENQPYSRRSSTIRARDAVWADPRIQSIAELSEHMGLTQRQVLTQINQAVAAEAVVLFRRIGIAKR